MSPVEALREFINVRLTAAAGEIFSEFQQTIVQYQEEIQTQRRLLEISRKESIPRASGANHDATQQRFCITEFWNKQSRLDQEEPEPPQIKEEQHEPEPAESKEEQEHLAVKQEDDTIIITVIDENFTVREFINVRLTAAAGEIFSDFQQTIVQYQEEIQTQRRLLEITLKPRINLHRSDVPEHRVCKEEQLWNQEMNSSLDQKPKHPQIKEEEEEICTSQVEEQLVLKQEVNTIMMIPIKEESETSEPEPDDELLFFQDFVGADCQHSPTPGQRPIRRCRGKNVDNVRYAPQRSLSVRKRTQTVWKPQYCGTCGKLFSRESTFLVHMRTHTEEKLFSCVTCGKSFNLQKKLRNHMRNHKLEEPHLCVTCGKSVLRKSLSYHMRTHTGERPHSCGCCGKRFINRSSLSLHMRTHTGERPFCCLTCGKTFINKSNLVVHLRVHTGDKPYPCVACGKCFINNSNLSVHMRTHKGEDKFP